MYTRLIAKVRVPKKNGKHGIGTAYPIAKDLLLTARHLVVFDDRDEEKPIEVHWFDMDCSTDETEIVYQGKDDIDVALMKCKFPEQIKIPTITVLSHQYPHENMRWKSMGYPIVRKGDDQH